MKIIKGLEQLSSEERLNQLGPSSWRREGSEGDLINVFKYLKEECKDMVPSDRTRGNAQNTETQKVPPDHQETLFTVSVAKHWHGLPSEAVESPSLEVFKSHLAMVLGNQLYVTLLERGWDWVTC